MWEIGIIIGLCSMVGIFTLLSFMLDQEHYFLKIFFLLLSFLFVGVGLFIIREMASDNYSASIGNILASVYSGYIYVFIFVFFYFVIKIIYNIVRSINNEKNKTGLEEDTF